MTVASTCCICGKTYYKKDIVRTPTDSPICRNCYDADPERMDEIWKAEEDEMIRHYIDYLDGNIGQYINEPGIRYIFIKLSNGDVVGYSNNDDDELKEIIQKYQ